MVLESLRLGLGIGIGIGRFLCIPLTLTVVLSSALPLPPLTSAALHHHRHNHRRRFASDSTMSLASQTVSPAPPVAKKVEHVMEMFGDVRIDNYYWLRDDSRTDPEVLSYLRQENDYTDSIMSGTKKFEDKLYAEIRGRIKEEDVSVPLRKGPYYYYEKTLEGKEYVQRCRRLISGSQKVPSVNDTVPMDPETPQEHVSLDENVKAQHHQYYSIGACEVSPNNKLIACAGDTKGDEICTVYVIDAETQAPIGEPLLGVKSYLEWAGDDALVYITMDETPRTDK